MRRSLRGHALPETRDEFALLYGQQCLQHYACTRCRLPFPGRTTSAAGWRETQISGTCEFCFDELFDETRVFPAASTQQGEST